LKGACFILIIVEKSFLLIEVRDSTGFATACKYFVTARELIIIAMVYPLISDEKMKSNKMKRKIILLSLNKVLIYSTLFYFAE